MLQIAALLTSLRGAFPDVYPHGLPQAKEKLQRYAILRPTTSERIGRSDRYVQAIELELVGPDYMALLEMHKALWPAFHFYGDRMRIDEELLPDGDQLSRTYSFTMLVELA